MKKIKVALVGFGFSGRVFHMPALMKNTDFDVKTIMARSQKNQEDIKEIYPFVNVVSNFEDILSDEEINLVIIATANSVHYEYTKKALLKGKNVVCEKPFVETLEKANELFDLAKSKKLILRVFHNRKYDGDIQTLKALMMKKDLGRLISFSTRFDRLRPELGDNWRFSKNDMAGLFYDLAPHLVHHALYLFGMPKKVTANLFFERENAVVDDHFELRLDYDNGFKAFIGGEMLERNPKPRIELVTDTYTYSKYGYDVPDTVDFETSQKFLENQLPSKLIDNNLREEHVELFIGSHYLFYQKLATDISNHFEDGEDRELALNVIYIMEKALLSNQLEKTIII